ncbi:flagellar assembly protein FliX [Tardiphaga sp.]|uniref:flagellar assembly protein FliX n=1 Tax=Tardiphaga sp. TaxID=1926292 RepID=UPI00260D2BE7|nr:flagellar assembly protein FliX [Tardiphaga sp.]MDB5618679.1 putative flagellar assembly protein [Tardiphaga sp.]
MRIYGPNGTTQGSTSSSTKRTASTGFSLPDTAPTTDTRPTVAPRAATSLDALLAMQGVEDPTERRKRSVARGRGALDVLDELKLAMLAGSFDANTVARLRMAASDLKTSSGDAGLDSVLSEIELRVEVELAKAGQSRV